MSEQSKVNKAVNTESNISKVEVSKLVSMETRILELVRKQVVRKLVRIENRGFRYKLTR